MSPSRRTLVSLALTLVLVLAGVTASLAAVWTDQADYQPGSVVTIHGDNSDGAGYLADEPIFVEVWGPNGFHLSSEPDNPTADANGAWSWQFPLWDTEAAVGDYTYTATGLTSNVSQSGTFTDASYTYRIVNVTPSTGTCGSTITTSAILQSCTVGTTCNTNVWVPRPYKMLSFGFSTVPGLPVSWIDSSGYTDATGKATASMVVPPGALYLYARHQYAFTPSQLYVSQGIQFMLTPAASVTTVTVSDALYDGSPHGGNGVVTGCGLNQSLPVTYEGRNTTTYGPSTTPPTDAGDYTASASFAGDANNSPSQGSANFTIAKADATINVVGWTGTYDGAAHGASGTATGVGGANLGGSLNLGPSYTDVPGGTANWTFTGGTNYNDASGSVPIEINKAPSTTAVTVAGGAIFTYDGNAHPATVSVTGAGGLNLAPAPVYSCDYVPVDVADSGCTASYTFTGDANHTGSSGSVTYTINKAPSTTSVTVASGASFTYDGTAHPATVSVTGAGGLNLAPAPVYSCGQEPVDVADSGCTASYTYPGDANHEGSSGSVTYTINKAPSTTAVTVAGSASFTYDGTAHPATVSVTGAGGLSLTPAPVYSCGHVPVNVADSGCTASYTYPGDANHEGSSASVTYTINQAGASVTPDSFTRQYSDLNPTFTGTLSGFLASDGVTAVYNTATPASTPGNYDITATLSPAAVLGNYNITYNKGTLTIEKEDAQVSFDANNPAALQVSAPGGSLNASALTLKVYVQEQPDLPAATAAAGDINLAGLTVTLAPLAGGSSITLNCNSTAAGAGYAVKTFTCTNSGSMPVGTYDVTASVTGSYYVGVGYDGFTVYDPSLGFATGGGWFYWPGTSDKTNFGFTMKYNKSGTNLQGNLLVIRHHQDGTISRIKSNALEGLALQNTGGCGIATFSGKATYMRWDSGLGAYVNSGGNAFSVYAEDCNNPGSGVDSFWVRSVGNLALPTTAAKNKVPIGGGNIAIPHTAKK